MNFYLAPQSWNNDGYRDVYSDKDIDTLIENTDWYETRDDAISDCTTLDADNRRDAVREARKLDGSNMRKN